MVRVQFWILDHPQNKEAHTNHIPIITLKGGLLPETQHKDTVKSKVQKPSSSSSVLHQTPRDQNRVTPTEAAQTETKLLSDLQKNQSQQPGFPSRPFQSTRQQLSLSEAF